MCGEETTSVELAVDQVHEGDSLALLPRIRPESISLSVWSPPYFVGKSYERELSFDDWVNLLAGVIKHHQDVLKPGGFMAVNIADILCFPDPTLPRVQANVTSTKRSPVTREMVLAAKAAHPEMTRYELAALLGCSEQTIQRRSEDNNVRGGKYSVQTRVKIVGGLLEQLAADAGLVMYDRRVWVKDPAWANSRWHSLSYRAVDEFEYVYIFWKPGITDVDRARLTPEEWRDWGSRAVWTFPSVRANDDHEAKFPIELPRRLIRLLTGKGDVVLDPFMGSGTSGLAAVEQGRRFIGLELMPHYAALARAACDAALVQRRRSS